jgi:hypothetical protein
VVVDRSIVHYWSLSVSLARGDKHRTRVPRFEFVAKGSQHQDHGLLVAAVVVVVVGRATGHTIHQCVVLVDKQCVLTLMLGCCVDYHLTPDVRGIDTFGWSHIDHGLFLWAYVKLDEPKEQLPS